MRSIHKFVTVHTIILIFLTEKKLFQALYFVCEGQNSEEII